MESTTDKDEPIYPCADCGVMRSKAEGGTTFTVCDDCWDKGMHFNRIKPDIKDEAPEEAATPIQTPVRFEHGFVIDADDEIVCNLLWTTHRKNWERRDEAGEYIAKVLSEYPQLSTANDELERLRSALEQRDALLAKIDRADFDGDFWIHQFNGKFQAQAYDEDGTVLQTTEYCDTALLAASALEERK